MSLVLLIKVHTISICVTIVYIGVPVYLYIKLNTLLGIL